MKKIIIYVFALIVITFLFSCQTIITDEKLIKQLFEKIEGYNGN